MSNSQAAGATGKPSNKQKQTSDANEASLNLEEIRELANLVNEHGFTDFEFENAKIRIRLSKQVNIQTIATPQIIAPAEAVQSQPVSTAAASEPSKTETKAEAAADEDASLYKITSPIVGTFYRSPAPDKPPYVSEGSKVTPETVVCIVEAMKLMNEIQAEVTGEIVKIYVENGQPVEYGQPLFGIRR
jgi:acetyl-CoA carboxylase biotin carboxyl carrier protein